MVSVVHPDYVHTIMEYTLAHSKYF